MDVEQLVRDLKKVRRLGIPRTRLDDVPALKEALARQWPELDDNGREHSLEDLLGQGANQLGAHDAQGIRLALGIGELPRNEDGRVRNSADRRTAFAAHYRSTYETVRRHGALEDQVLTKLAKAIFSPPSVPPPPDRSGDQPGTAQHGGTPLQPISGTSTAIAGADHQPDGLDDGQQGAADHRSAVENSSARISRSTITSRSRAYLAIDSFEQDLRQLIESRLLDHLPPEEVLGAEYDQLCARRAQDDVSATGVLTQYLYPQQAYDVLLRHAVALPAELADVLRMNLAALDGFVPVRNRVMHGRPLQPDDLDETNAFIGRFRSRYFRQTELALSNLASDSDWQPRPRIGSSPTERILHNLPSADFDETGLLGREEEINDIVSKVKLRHNRVFTLIGEGGIGKTALALEVSYRLADAPEPPFEAILWTSLKSERLTPAGVQEISSAIHDIDGATRALGQELDHTFQGSARELAETLGEMTTLIVIDNLETVQGSDVVSLYEALPQTVTFLFTSRVGVGQIERRIPVGPLEEESAELLFRKFARSRGQSELAELPPPVVDDICGQLRHSPLAIRWYILSVEAGRTPTDTLRDQKELLRFCVENVVNALSSDEKSLLEVLRVLDHPVSFEELGVISEMEIDILRRAAQRLTQASLLVWSQFTGTESELLALSTAARAFLRIATGPEVTEDVIRRENAYNQERERERERIADHGRYLDPNVIFERSPSDAPTAHLLKQALRESKSGHPEAASATMARARALNPDYFEVDRVDAILASFRKERATSRRLFRSALSNCDTDDESSWVGYFFASLLARQMDDLPNAIRMTEQAHERFNSYDTAHQLGNFYVWDHRFEEGKELIESAFERAPGKPRFERIATTSLVECFRRWSEDDLVAGRASASLDRALRGLHLGIELHDSGSTDERLRQAILEAAVAALKAARQVAELGPEEEKSLSSALQHLAGDARFRLLLPWRHLEHAVFSLTAAMRSRLVPGFVATVLAPEDTSMERILGSVTSLHGRFGFIAHPDFPHNVFFHAGSLRVPTMLEDLDLGSLVEFTPSKNDKGQDQAVDVILAGRDVNPTSAAPHH